MNKKYINRIAYALTLSAALFTSCSSESKDTDIKPEEEVKSKYFISAVGGDTEAKAYLLTVDDLTAGSISIKGNGLELPRSGYNWIFPTASTALGFIYQQGDPGVGLGVTINNAGDITPSGSEFLIEDRFTTYGVANGLAITSVSGQAVPGNDLQKQSFFNIINPANGNVKTRKEIITTNLAGNGEFYTFSGIVDAGNGEFLTGMVPSKTVNTSGGGSSTGESDYPDSLWVAKFDTNLKLKKIYRDGRLSYSSGRMRSQYYSQIANDDAGNTYVFSGAYNPLTTKKAGVIRINKGADNFDASYYWDIQTASGGYYFMKVWHITGNYFLLNFYNKQGSRDRLDGYTKYAVIDAVNKTFKWVESGLPAYDQITSSSNAVSFDGKAFLPVTATGSKPAIYVIDPVTATAKRGIEVDANSINGLGKLTHTK